jgi:hypothetical protein
MIKLKIYGRDVTYRNMSEAVSDLEECAADFRNLVDYWRDHPVPRARWQRDLATVEAILADVNAGVYKESVAA